MSAANFYLEEGEIKGAGQDLQGAYTWTGTHSKFEKVYEDSSLIFEGEVEEEGKSVEGTFTDGKESGEFSFKRVVDWVGWYIHDDEKFSILMTEDNFEVDPENDDDEHITGSGTDTMGDYEWRGRFTKTGFQADKTYEDTDVKSIWWGTVTEDGNHFSGYWGWCLNEPQGKFILDKII